MGFYGDGDSKAFANIENINMKMEMVTVIARLLLTIKMKM